MKSLIMSAFLLLFVVQVTLASKWETLTGDDVYQSSYIRTLRDAGVSYVRQKGIFESTKLRLPGNDYFIPSDSYATIERRNASDWTDYRFNLTLIGGYFDVANPLVKTSFVVSSKPSNGNFIVTSYRYTIDPYGNPPFLGIADVYAEYTLLDLRPLNNGSSDHTKSLNKAKDEIVAQAIKSGDFPDSNYRIKYVYEAYSIYYNGEGYKESRWNVKLVNSEGKYFYVEIKSEYFEWQDEEEASFSYSILSRPSNE